jgi:hypothetical protein
VAVTLRARSYANAGAQEPVITHTENAANAPLPPGMYRDATGALIPLPGSENGATVIPAILPEVSDAAAARPSSGPTRAERLRALLSEPIAALKAPAPAPIQKPAPVVTQMQQQVKQTPPPAPRPQTPRYGGSASTTPPTPQPGSSKSPGDDSPRGPKNNDPTSDTTPPQLVSAVFDPPQVHDGEDGVILVTATDDISGVRGISGTVVSPGGKALQGFSCQPDGTMPGRFIGHVNIPKDAEEGTWRVNFMSLSDNASNTATLHLSTGGVPATAVLRVISSNPDKEPPTLTRVWLDRPQIKPGDRNVVYIEARDDRSGVKYASGVFLSPAKSARISFGCQKSGDIDTSWTCTMSTPTIVDCGNWQLEQVQLQDGANNMATVRLDNPMVGQVKLSILGDSCDNTPPVLQMLTVDPRVVSNQQARTVSMTATVTDDISGVYGVMAQAVGPGQGSGSWIQLKTSADNVWTGSFEVPLNAGKGTWHIAFVQVIDKGNNLKLYTQSDAPLVNATFEVR